MRVSIRDLQRLNTVVMAPLIRSLRPFRVVQHPIRRLLLLLMLRLPSSSSGLIGRAVVLVPRAIVHQSLVQTVTLMHSLSECILLDSLGFCAQVPVPLLFATVEGNSNFPATTCIYNQFN